MDPVPMAQSSYSSQSALGQDEEGDYSEHSDQAGSSAHAHEGELSEPKVPEIKAEQPVVVESSEAMAATLVPSAPSGGRRGRRRVSSGGVITPAG